MKIWLKVSLLLCSFGFFNDFRPSEPFVTEYLTGEWRDISAEQLTRNVYPWATYAYLIQLVIVFLITDMLRYKPLIIVSAGIGIIIWSMLLWTYTLGALQAVQVFYGTFMATEVAYYTYIYASIDRKHFQKVTGFTRSATLSGRFCAGVIAQLLISFQLMNLRELNYITLGGQIVALLLAIALPGVSTSVYFYAKTPGQIEEDTHYRSVFAKPVEPVKATFSGRRAVSLLWAHFKDSYTDSTVIQWSVWWALATCGFMQVQSYVQLLWHEINPTQENIYNGAIEAALTLLGVGGAVTAGYINNELLKRFDLWILTGCSAIEGGLLLWAALTNEVWVSYVAYVLFGMLYHFMITVASVNVAKRLQDDSFGLVFGINTLIALVFQTILTIVVISESGFALGSRDQFLVYGGYFIVLSGIYGLYAVGRILWHKYTDKKDNGN